MITLDEVVELEKDVDEDFLDRARKDILAFTLFTKPDYQINWHHRLLARKLNAFARGEIQYLMVFMPPRHGKNIADSCPVLTTNGWSTHGELKVGDFVFSPSGRAVRILCKSDSQELNARVHFSDGSIVDCHLNHEWTVFDRSYGKEFTYETNHFLKKTKFGKQMKLMSGGRCKYQLPSVSALEFNKVELPIHPYVLGAWLGDGSAGKACVTHSKSDQSYIDKIESLGYKISAVCIHKQTKVHTTYFSGPRPNVRGELTVGLQNLGIYKNKRIPEIYKHSSVDQRLELMAGLIDTDGHVDKSSGRVRIVTVSIELAEDIYDVATSLGWRPYINFQDPVLSSSGIQGKKRVYTIGFQPDRKIPVALPRKIIKRFAPRRRIGIVKVEKINSREKGHCIQVDSPDGLYLIDHNLIPTHNSELVSRRLPAFLHGLYPEAEIMCASYLDNLAAEMCMAVQSIIDSPEYKKIFPHILIPKPRVVYTSGTRNSTEHTIHDASTWKKLGRYMGAGVNGSFTGKGCNFCFPKGVLVSTPYSGYKDISQLKEGEYVWSYNHINGIREIRRIEAVSSRAVSELVRVTTIGGRQVLCTPDHPIFSETKQEYRQADSFQRGEGIIIEKRAHENTEDDGRSKMHALFKGIRKTALRIREGIQEKYYRSLLFESMLSCAPQLQESSEVSNLCKSNIEQIGKILPFGMQAKLGGWKGSEESIQENFPTNKAINIASRWIQMFCLFDWCRIIGASFERSEIRQRFGESNHTVPQVSQARSFGFDSIKSIERFGNREIVTVYDIQVEGSNNFFANGILVHNCIIDDPIRGREIADSEAYRDKLWKFWLSDLYSRLETSLKDGKKGQALLTLTRWHEDDLAGRLIEAMKANPKAVQWDIISLPAIRVTKDDPLDPREIGQPLWPAKYDLEKMEEIKASLTSDGGVRAWSSLYQQDPTPDGGNVFKDKMFEFCDMPAEFHYTFITADTAYDEKKDNDFTVFTAFGVIADTLFVRDVMMEQIRADEVEATFEPFIRRYLGYGCRGVWIEPKGHGIYLNQAWAKKGMMIPTEEDIKEFYKDRNQNKVQRAKNAVPNLANRKVYINKLIANKEDLVAQCLGFPKGKHDDFADTLIDGIKMSYGAQPGILDLFK